MCLLFVFLFFACCSTHRVDVSGPVWPPCASQAHARLMLDAGTIDPTRNRWGESQRLHRPTLSLWEHALFQLGGVVLILVAVLLGVFVTDHFFLLLLLVIPYYGFWFALLEKVRLSTKVVLAFMSVADARRLNVPPFTVLAPLVLPARAPAPRRSGA